MRSLCGVAGLNQMYSTESATKRFFFNMGATRDNLIWRNPDPEEWIHSQVVNKEQATTELYLAMIYGRVGTRDTYQPVRLSASTYS